MPPSAAGAFFNLVTLVACVCLDGSVVFADSDVQSVEIKLEYEQIFVNILDGPTFSLIVEPDQTGWDLRGDINEIEGIPYDHMQIRMDYTQLNYTKQLFEYNIRTNTTLTLETPGRLNRRLLKFKVKTLDGREMEVSMRHGNSVASVKEIIKQWTDIPPVEQRLLLNGKQMEDERKLIHYHIYSGTTVHLGPPLEDCHQVVTIFVKTLGAATIEVEINLADTVNDLKERIWQEAGVPMGVQRLFANKRIIAGKDHLCDLGLEAGSTVYKYLYSSKITSLDQVARLQEPPVASSAADSSKAPIFREVDVSEPEHSVRRRSISLYKDARNWIARIHLHPGWSDLFDPVAYWNPDPDDGELIERYQRDAAALSDGNELQRLEAEIIRAQLKLSLALRPYRVTANHTLVSHQVRNQPGISLGGESTYASEKQLVTLGADVNNWSPDAFSDADVMRLFEVSECVREVMARDAQTIQAILSIDGQRRINRAILYTYLEALAGYRPPLAHDQVSKDEQCGICIDDLEVEPAIKLACEHAFHADCILSWTIISYNQLRFTTCPLCRQRFMFPYEALGKAELETPELQRKQEDVEVDRILSS